MKTPLLSALSMYKKYMLLTLETPSTELVLMYTSRASEWYEQAKELARTQAQQLLVERYTRYVEEHMLVA